MSAVTLLLRENKVTYALFLGSGPNSPAAPETRQAADTTEH